MGDTGDFRNVERYMLAHRRLRWYTQFLVDSPLIMGGFLLCGK
jgi:hypothetical protein